MASPSKSWVPLARRQAEVHDSEADVQRAIRKLADASNGTVLTQLTSAVRHKLQTLAERIDTLEDEAMVADDAVAAEAALGTIAAHRAEHSRLSHDLRTKLVAARGIVAVRMEEQRASASAREAAPADESGAEADESADDGGLPARSAVQSAVEATEALKRTRKLMASEVARTEQALSTLHESGGTLRRAADEHDAIADGVGSGSKTLRRIRRREAMDKALTWGSFGMFLLVVLRVFLRRMPLAGLWPLGVDPASAPRVLSPSSPPDHLRHSELESLPVHDAAVQEKHSVLGDSARDAAPQGASESSPVDASDETRGELAADSQEQQRARDEL